jgi:peptidoglycan/xylan/chitin deacetylase (PgdA/CDA1 family)
MDLLQSQFPPAAQLLQQYPTLRSLTWNELTSLMDSGVTIGSHGVDHEIHHANQPKIIREKELEDSKYILETKLGYSCDHFALPNGNAVMETPSQVQQAGYKLGFTVSSRFATGKENCYLLPRLGFEKFRHLIHEEIRQK